MKQHRGKYIICLILVMIGSLLYANLALAGDASVTVGMPAENQAYQPGDTVTINGTATNMTGVTVTVYNSATAPVYTAQPAVTSGQFSTGFTLADDAITGTYTIRIGGTGLSAPYIRHFLVQQNASTPSVTITQPTANQIFNPGNGVTISGTATNLTVVTVTVYNSGTAPVYTAQPAVTSGQFSTGFTLASDAVTGTYTIRIGGTGLTAIARTFLVQQSSSSPSVALTLPAADQTYNPGGTITINGTAQNLTGVTITILNGSASVFTTSLAVTGGLFSTSYTLPADAAVGNYKIQITGQELSSTYERNIVVQTSGGDNCFIATAAFGSKFQPSVALLRQFRDKFLLTNDPGRAFVAFYYRNSPPIAAYIAGNEILKATVRVILTPAVAVAYLMLHPRMLFTLLIIFVTALLMLRKTRRTIPFSV